MLASAEQKDSASGRPPSGAPADKAGGYDDTSSRITLEDVQRLQADPSPETRSDFACKFGQQYDGFIDAGSKEFADAILRFLAADVEEIVRQSLAESIAESPNLPPDMALRLAADAIDVAKPILLRSSVLDDGQLAEIVGEQHKPHALVVAGRNQISEGLSDALIASEYQDVILRLIANPGAEISDDALALVARNYGDNAMIQDKLSQRPDLPAELVDHMLDAIGDKLQWDLITERSMDPVEAQRLIAATKERSAKKLANNGKAEKLTLRSMHERMAAGELKALDILAFLKDGDVGLFEASLATMARLDSTRTRRLLYNMDKRCLAVLCLRAGLGTPQYLAVRMALDLADRGVNEIYAARIKYPAKTVRFVQEQYERIRKDRNLRSQMLQS